MRTTVGLLACAVVLTGGCAGRPATGSAPVAASAPSSSAAAGTTIPVSPAHSASPAKAGIVLIVAASRYGPVLFDGSGQAIYTFGTERTSTPACYGDCASAWPPVLTAGAPVARGGVRPELLGVTVRRDGSAQATYRGKPLYFYAGEGKHVVLCHNVREFGGLWLAVTKAGTPAPT